ncbi:hypothetical protein [Actinoallomurus vinaceus]
MEKENAATPTAPVTAKKKKKKKKKKKGGAAEDYVPVPAGPRALIYDASIPLKGKNIHNFRESIPNCRFAQEAIRVYSIADAVKKLRERDTLFGCVAFCGHATHGLFGVAGNTDPATGLQREEYDRRYDLKYTRLQDVSGELLELRYALDDDAVVVLFGCDVASDTDKEQGTKLLTRLSLHLPDVWVAGTIEETAPLYEVGDKRVEVHYARNDLDLGAVTADALRVAFNGKEETDRDAWPDALTLGTVAYWPAKPY